MAWLACNTPLMPSQLSPGNLLAKLLDSALDEIPSCRLGPLGIVDNRLHCRGWPDVPNVLSLELVVAECLIRPFRELPLNCRGKLSLRRNKVPRIHVQRLQVFLSLHSLLRVHGFQPGTGFSKSFRPIRVRQHRQLLRLHFLHHRRTSQDFVFPIWLSENLLSLLLLRHTPGHHGIVGALFPLV